jgi:hypothetical protein
MGAGQPLEERSYPLPGVLDPQGFLVKMSMATICGSLPFDGQHLPGRSLYVGLARHHYQVSYFKRAAQLRVAFPGPCHGTGLSQPTEISLPETGRTAISLNGRRCDRCFNRIRWSVSQIMQLSSLIIACKPNGRTATILVVLCYINILLHISILIIRLDHRIAALMSVDTPHPPLLARKSHKGGW